MKTVKLEPCWYKPFKRLPVRVMSKIGITFGDEGVVNFDFDTGDITFTAGGEVAVIARIKSAHTHFHAIAGFEGIITGDNFEVIIVQFLSLKSPRMTVRLLSPGGAPREIALERFDIQGDLRVLGELRFQCDWNSTSSIQFSPEFSNLAKVLAAILFSHVAEMSAY